MPGKSDQLMQDVIKADGRYPLEAFGFLHNGLERAVRDAHGEELPEPGNRHVTGRQMCMGLRDLAIDRWGMLAPTVLARWNIHSTFDFGQMVYLLIEHDFMFRTDEDSIEDFRDVYEFQDAFDVAMNLRLDQ